MARVARSRAPGAMGVVDLELPARGAVRALPQFTGRSGDPRLPVYPRWRQSLARPKKRPRLVGDRSRRRGRPSRAMSLTATVPADRPLCDSHASACNRRKPRELRARPPGRTDTPETDTPEA